MRQDGAAHDSGGGGERSLTAADVAQAVGGELRGPGARRLRGVAPLDRAGSDALSFLASGKYAALFADSAAGAVLVSPELAACAGRPDVRIVVADPYEAMMRVLPLLYPEPPLRSEVHPTAVIGRGARIGRDVLIEAHSVIGASATLGERVVIGPNCVIGDGVEIGDDSRLQANVTLYSGAVVGRRVRLHAGACVASDGFGYVFQQGTHRKIPHVGRCVIGDDVEIGANSTIDRGSIDDTVVGAGTKIDNLVHVAHNVRIGRRCLLMAQVGVAGSARIGDGCILAGQVGVGGHVTIGDGARIGGQAGVFGDVPAGETWSGYPARPHKESLRSLAALSRLSRVMRDVERLVKEHET